MPLVRVREDETLENALRRFKRKCEKSGILSEVKKRQHYLKPSQKRKIKALAARKKARLAAAWSAAAKTKRRASISRSAAR